MKTPKKSQATDRISPSITAGKRRFDEDDHSPVRSRKHHSSFLNQSSSSHPTLDSDESPQPSKKRLRRGRRAELTSRPIEPQPDSAFLEMYTFTSNKPKPGEVVDLTSSAPREQPKWPNSHYSQSTKPIFNPHLGPKKLVVKNLRTTPRVDPEYYFEKVWGQQESSLTAVFNGDKVPHSLEELYKGAENVCRQGKAPELYTRLKDKSHVHLTDHVAKYLVELASSSNSNIEVLKAFVEAWSAWQKQLLTTRQIFYYMDQTYLLRSTQNASVTEMGLIFFRTIVFEDYHLRKKVKQGLVDLVSLDRRGQINNSDFGLLRRAIDTFHELSIYSSDFEPLFHRTTDAYFRSWRESESEKGDLAHYVRECTRLLEREMARCDQLSLDRSTRVQLCDLFDSIIIEEKVDLLTNEDSVLDLLQHEKSTELEQAWTLLQRKGQGEKLGPSFDRFTIEEGTAIVFDEKRESEMVINLLDFKRRLDHFLKFSFHNNDKMGNGLHKSFEYFINKTKKTQKTWDTDNAKPGEMIAKHVDLLLKGGVKAVPQLITSKNDSSKAEEEHDFDDAPGDEDAEINIHLSNALDLFRFVHGKAVFEAFYKKDLARRLLMGRSASNDAERNMLTRLKNECGSSFTHNLESMFKDMDLARDEMASYNYILDDRGTRSAGPDLHVNVLSASAWPTYPDVAVNIPPAIAKVMADFETHYKSKHSGRKLTWKNALAHCQLKAKFPKGNKEIVVSGFQAVVLLLFNDVPSNTHLSYPDIQTATGLSDAELRRTLQSLACAKYRVLTKNPKGREVNTADTFAFNAAFSDPKLRIKINQIQLKETREENKETHQRVAADRHYETQAAIVRIMKSKKTITHNELIVEVIKATRSRGVLDQSDIKKNIEKLIEKDYMERVEGTNSYSYVA